MNTTYPSNPTLAQNHADFIAGRTPDPMPGVRERVYTGKGKGPPPSGTDEPPSRAVIFDRHAAHLAPRGPAGLVHVFGNRKQF